MKQHWKQILSFILAIIITLTPLSSINQVYATDGDNGSGPGGGKSSSGWTGGWTSNDHVGYRFYVIDTFNNCQRASDVYDFYFSEPLNVVKSKHFTNTRFEELSTDTSQYHEAFVNELAEKKDINGKLAYNADKIINIRPIALVGGSWVTGGADFQNFFINKAGKGAGHVGIDTTVNPGQGGQSNKGGTGNEEKDSENQARDIVIKLKKAKKLLGK